MYFPYLRGKQYELIAIRELIEKKIIDNKKILPVIEPVKITSTLTKTIKVMIEKEFNFSIIVNPQVGNLVNNQKDIIDSTKDFFSNKHFLLGYITNKEINNSINDFKNQYYLENQKFLIIHNSNLYPNEFILTFNEDNPPKFNLIPDQRTYARKIKNNKVLFVDHFNEQKKNSEYSNITDEFFTEDHLFYKDEGFIGFSDYLTIGSSYSDSGFRPYAVVIHITYFDKDNVLRIKHFVSDSNNDYEDTPNKFYEALTKLIQWKKEININSYALDILQKHYDNQTYPGLGSLKKLSIMHHIEIINNYLGEKKSELL